MEYSDDVSKIKEWAPLIVDGRKGNEKVAATHMNLGTDANFGELTRVKFSKVYKTKKKLR